MRVQFGTAGLLRVMTFLAVMMASIGFVVRNHPELSHYKSDGRWIFPMFIFTGPFWLPFVFGAYVIGRRELSWKCVLAFAVAEAVVIAVKDFSY